MKIIRSAFVILLVLFIEMPVAQALDGWEANIVVGISTAENKLSLGQRSDASDGVDGKYDVPAMLNGDIKAYFVEGGGGYWRDIKSADGHAKTWVMRVDSRLNGEIAAVKWKAGSLPASKRFILIDRETGTATDMKVTDSYTYNNQGTREFAIEVTE